MKFKAIFILLISHIGFLGLYGQEEPEAVQRTVQLFAWSDPVFDLELWQDDEAKEVLIPNGAPTEPFRYVGSPVLSIGKTLLNEEGESYFHVMGSVQLPDTQDTILLIVLPESGGQRRIVPFVGNNREHVTGSIRMINMTGNTLFTRISDENVQIAAGGQTFLMPKEDQGQSFTVLMAQESGGQMERVYSARWGRLANQRTTVFLLRDPQTRQLTMRRYVER